MPSVTFKAVVAARRKDGSYPVRSRVTFKGVSRRLPTNLVARPADLTRSLHIKSPDITGKTAALIAQMQATLADVSPFALEGWDVDRVVAHIRASLVGQDFRLDFFAFADGAFKLVYDVFDEHHVDEEREFFQQLFREGRFCFVAL